MMVARLAWKNDARLERKSASGKNEVWAFVPINGTADDCTTKKAPENNQLVS